MAGKATKLKSGNWRCKAYYTDESGKYTSKSFTAETKKKAEAAAAAFLVDRKHDAKPENKTLGELADIFIESRSNLLSPSTIAGYRKIRRTAFQSIIDYRLGLITKQIYQKAVNDYYEGRSYKTVLSAHSFFNKVLKENNVFIAEGIQLPPKEKKEIEIPTIEEVEMFIGKTVNTRIYLYCLFAVALGLRKSEIIALQWKDIDLENKTVSINKARVKDEFGIYVLKAPKTYEGKRVLHLPSIIINALGEPGADSDFVINDSPDAIESMYKRLCRKEGFNYNFHSLRHYFASIMLQSGIPDKYAKERMGHATENMLQTVYQHTFKSKQEEYDSILESFFEKTLSFEK